MTLGVAIRMGRLFKDRGRILTVFLAQFGGAFAAAITTFLLNGGRGGSGVQFPAPNGSAGAVGAVFFEATWTAFLVYTVCAVMTDVQDKEQTAVSRRGHSRSYHGLAIGFVVVAGIFCAGQSGAGSGGVFNPACVRARARVSPRDRGGWGSCAPPSHAPLFTHPGHNALRQLRRLGVATAVVANVNGLGSVWVYVAGPFAGSVLGASLFTLLHLDRSISVDGIGGSEQPTAETYTYLDTYQESSAPYI